MHLLLWGAFYLFAALSCLQAAGLTADAAAREETNDVLSETTLPGRAHPVTNHNGEQVRWNRFDGERPVSAAEQSRRAPMVNGHTPDNFLRLANEEEEESQGRRLVEENIESGTSEEQHDLRLRRQLPNAAARRSSNAPAPSASDHDGDDEEEDSRLHHDDLASFAHRSSASVPRDAVRESTDTVRNPLRPSQEDSVLPSTWSPSTVAASVAGHPASVSRAEAEEIAMALQRRQSNGPGMVRQSSGSPRARLSGINVGGLPYVRADGEAVAPIVLENAMPEQEAPSKDYDDFLAEAKRNKRASQSSKSFKFSRRGSSSDVRRSGPTHPYATAAFRQDVSSPSISRLPSQPSERVVSLPSQYTDGREHELSFPSLRQGEVTERQAENPYTAKLAKIRQVFEPAHRQVPSIADSASSCSIGHYIMTLFLEAGLLDLSIPRLLRNRGDARSRLVWDTWHKFSLVAMRYTKAKESRKMAYNMHLSKKREVEHQTNEQLRMELKKLYHLDLQEFLNVFPQYRKEMGDMGHLFPTEMSLHSPFHVDISVYEAFMTRTIRTLFEEFINVTPKGRKLLQYWLTQNITSPLVMASYPLTKAALGMIVFIIMVIVQKTVLPFARGYFWLAFFLPLFVSSAGLYAYFTNYCVLHGLFNSKSMQNGYWHDYDESFYEDNKRRKFRSTMRQMVEYGRFVRREGFIPKLIFEDDGRSVYSISTPDEAHPDSYSAYNDVEGQQGGRREANNAWQQKEEERGHQMVEMMNKEQRAATDASTLASSDFSLDDLRRNRRMLEPFKLFTSILQILIMPIVVTLILFFTN